MRSKKNVKIKIDLTDWSKRFFSFFFDFCLLLLLLLLYVEQKMTRQSMENKFIAIAPRLQSSSLLPLWQTGKMSCHHWFIIEFFLPIINNNQKKKTGRESTKWFNYLLEQQQQKRRDFFFIRLNILYLSALVIYNIEKRNVDWSWKFFFSKFRFIWFFVDLFVRKKKIFPVDRFTQ